jgi:hypothetical protein
VGWTRIQIRDFFAFHGFTIQEWESVRTDWLTLSSSSQKAPQAASPSL